MSISNTQALQLALVPGIAEELQNVARQNGNLAWSGLAKGVINARNGLYVGVGVGSMGLTGRALLVFTPDSEYSDAKYTTLAIAALGVGIAGVAAKKLYDATSLVQHFMNRRPE